MREDKMIKKDKIFDGWLIRNAAIQQWLEHFISLCLEKKYSRNKWCIYKHCLENYALQNFENWINTYQRSTERTLICFITPELVMQRTFICLRTMTT